MTDDHHDLRCGECGERPRLVRLGSERPTEHAAYGVECDCTQSDGETPVGSYVDLNSMPDAWQAE